MELEILRRSLRHSNHPVRWLRIATNMICSTSFQRGEHKLARWRIRPPRSRERRAARARGPLKHRATRATTTARSMNVLELADVSRHP